MFRVTSFVHKGIDTIRARGAVSMIEVNNMRGLNHTHQISRDPMRSRSVCGFQNIFPL